MGKFHVAELIKLAATKEEADVPRTHVVNLAPDAQHAHDSGVAQDDPRLVPLLANVDRLALDRVPHVALLISI